jgi:uncharacterized phage-associated protein
MATSAHDVAAALRQALPGLPVMKLHKLLYYCQGHHLAHFEEPLFSETISAWDMGPVVGTLWYAEKNDEELPAPRPLTNGQLNTVGYVISRYGRLSGIDLQHLTHAEDPWRMADENRPQGSRIRIEPAWMRDYFRFKANADDEDAARFSRDQIAAFAAAGPPRREPGSVSPDSRQAIESRIDAARARMASA